MKVSCRRVICKLEYPTKMNRCRSPIRNYSCLNENINRFNFPEIKNTSQSSSEKSNCINQITNNCKNNISVRSSNILQELNTKLNIKIRDKCKELINASKPFLGSNMKLRRKFRMLSISPKRESSIFIQSLSCVSQENVIAGQTWFKEIIKNRERALRNLNIIRDSEEQTKKVFQLCIKLKNINL